MRHVVISQPRYLPTLNYLQRLYNADCFVYLDDVQRQGRGWENRNKILIGGEARWLTIPVASSNRSLICEAAIAGTEWVSLHRDMLTEAYRKAPYFEKRLVHWFYDDIPKFLKVHDYSYARLLIYLLDKICVMLNINPETRRATDLDVPKSAGPAHLVDLSVSVGADVYVSGGNGKLYGVQQAFDGKPIRVAYHCFAHPVYEQRSGCEFVTWMCFWDALFNVGMRKTIEWVHAQWDLEVFENEHEAHAL